MTISYENPSVHYNETRTTAYRFTVVLQDGKPVSRGAESLAALRKSISQENAFQRKIGGRQQYVKLQGRGPRPSRRYWQSLPLDMSDYADVYVYNR